jgi:hypothetical protein
MAFAALAALWAVLVYGEADRLIADEWALRCEQRVLALFRRDALTAPSAHGAPVAPARAFAAPPQG